MSGTCEALPLVHDTRYPAFALAIISSIKNMLIIPQSLCFGMNVCKNFSVQWILYRVTSHFVYIKVSQTPWLTWYSMYFLGYKCLITWSKLDAASTILIKHRVAFVLCWIGHFCTAAQFPRVVILPGKSTNGALNAASMWREALSILVLLTGVKLLAPDWEPEIIVLPST